MDTFLALFYQFEGASENFHSQKVEPSSFSHVHEFSLSRKDQPTLDDFAASENSCA